MVKCFYGSADLVVRVLIDERSGHEQGTSEPMGLGLLVPTRRHFQRRSIRNTLDRPHVPWNDDVAKFVAEY